MSSAKLRRMAYERSTKRRKSESQLFIQYCHIVKKQKSISMTKLRKGIKVSTQGTCKRSVSSTKLRKIATTKTTYITPQPELRKSYVRVKSSHRKEESVSTTKLQRKIKARNLDKRKY